MKIIYLLPFLVTATFIGCSEDSSSTSVNDSANSSATPPSSGQNVRIQLLKHTVLKVKRFFEKTLS